MQQFHIMRRLSRTLRACGIRGAVGLVVEVVGEGIREEVHAVHLAKDLTAFVELASEVPVVRPMWASRFEERASPMARFMLPEFAFEFVHEFDPRSP